MSSDSENPVTASGPTPTLNRGAVRTMNIFTFAYPPLVSTVLWLLGATTLLSTNANAWMLFVGAAIVSIGGVHRWLQWILEGQSVPQPWMFPTVLTAAMAAATIASVLGLFPNVNTVVPLPLWSTGLALLGAGVFSVTEWRHRFVGALAAVISVPLVTLIIGWVTTEWEQKREQEQEQEQARTELLQEVSEVPHEIAVLDSPEWEPADISTSVVSHRVYITYTPTDPSLDVDGFNLTLRSESTGEDGPAPLHEPCQSEGGGKECEEHGDVVIADESQGSSLTLEARSELSEGVAAHLIANMSEEGGNNPSTEFPDVDLVGLSESIRPMEADEAEEIVSAVVN